MTSPNSVRGRTALPHRYYRKKWGPYPFFSTKFELP